MTVDNNPTLKQANKTKQNKKHAGATERREILAAS